ncbi:TPA: putative holin [Klebsiella michiganensis]|nr:putative holin [Klebsiella michiganensis]MDM4565689.1 putative holin [Klebsiella michiganensis]MDM4583240.1 putative holin [Klebsiella michiganensis]UHD33817.1 putative holin [Klebsiella michiganensis]ULF60198.1 putative holin [Klebsiella michiganensis]
MSLLHKVRHQRLRNWIILAVALLAAIAVISPEQLGVTLYKLSLISIAAILGYHLDRALFPYASPGSYPDDCGLSCSLRQRVPGGSALFPTCQHPWSSGSRHYRRGRIPC